MPFLYRNKEDKDFQMVLICWCYDPYLSNTVLTVLTGISRLYMQRNSYYFSFSLYKMQYYFRKNL
jgi:hypothetical protein